MYNAQAFADAGLPAGVLNLVFGDLAEISAHLIPQEPDRLVVFTGSTPVGRHLTALVSENMTSVLMEPGGYAPVIICEDSDVVAAATTDAIRKMRAPTLCLKGLQAMHSRTTRTMMTA